jgi:hypothetical protein
MGVLLKNPEEEGGNPQIINSQLRSQNHGFNVDQDGSLEIVGGGREVHYSETDHQGIRVKALLVKALLEIH